MKLAPPLSTFKNDRLYARAIYIYYNRFDGIITIRHSIFRAMNAIRQTVFFVEMQFKSYFVNSNFNFGDNGIQFA